LDKLANKDVEFVTSELKEYADGKTYYKSPADFLKGCKAKELPDKRCGFLGGPEDKFTAMAPHVMKVLHHLGMTESSRVLEVGVGLGRNAQSLINFLDEDKYCGIEPNGDMLAVGVAHMVGKKAIDEKRPMFSTNSDFDFGVFFDDEPDGNQLFDVVTSRSVWSHTSKMQNEKYLASFAKYTKPTAFLATSVIKVTEDCSKDYNGTEWVGKSHDANNEGIVIHCMPWIREACAKAGLIAKSLAEEAPELMKGDGVQKWNDLGQPWIVIRHDPSESQETSRYKWIVEQNLTIGNA
jgi:SAM-dependent methyltransferase